MSTAAERPPGLRQSKKQRTRQRIVNVARRLFGERGYHATTVADIAAGSGISVPTLFKYFPSKEEILFSDYPDRRESIRRRLRTRPARQTAIEATIAWVRDEPPGRAARDPDRELTLRGILDADPELEAAEHKRVMLNQHIIAAEIARDLDEPEDHLRPQLLAATTVAALLTVRNVGRRHQTASRGDDPNELLDHATAFLYAGADGLCALPPPRY